MLRLGQSYTLILDSGSLQEACPRDAFMWFCCNDLETAGLRVSYVTCTVSLAILCCSLKRRTLEWGI